MEYTKEIDATRLDLSTKVSLEIKKDGSVPENAIALKFQFALSTLT